MDDGTKAADILTDASRGATDIFSSALSWMATMGCLLNKASVGNVSWSSLTLLNSITVLDYTETVRQGFTTNKLWQESNATDCERVIHEITDLIVIAQVYEGNREKGRLTCH